SRAKHGSADEHQPHDRRSPRICQWRSSSPTVIQRHRRTSADTEVGRALSVSTRASIWSSASRDARSGDATLLAGFQPALASGAEQPPFNPVGPWSFPWSLSERISHHLRASQGRSHAVRDLRTGSGRGSSPGSPIVRMRELATATDGYRVEAGASRTMIEPTSNLLTASYPITSWAIM